MKPAGRPTRPEIPTTSTSRVFLTRGTHIAPCSQHMVLRGGVGEEEEIARLIVRYLSRHPEAKDTREGIATWWLRQQQIEYAIQAVHRALDVLLRRGLILEHRGPDLRSYFSINSERLDDVAQFLGEPKPSP